MNEAAVLPLHAWETFYVIVGSCAGALIGLQFVVMTLIASVGTKGSGDAVSAYGSPTVVHFCVALLISAALSAPWKGAGSPGFILTACGIGGLAYAITILHRARRQRDYNPVFEDWLWHTAFPMLAYAGVLFTGLWVWRGSADALYVVGAATLLLVFIGIHNAWDTVLYVTVDMPALRERTPETTRPTSTPGDPPIEG